MKLTIALCLCWAGQIIWMLAIMRAAARPMPKPTAAGRLTNLNPKLLHS